MQIELGEDQRGGAPVLASERAANVGRDGRMDMGILLGHVITTTNSTLRENTLECWESALRKLGHVSIFAFATGEFMLIGPGGERVRGESLTAALQEMLRCAGFDAAGRGEGN